MENDGTGRSHQPSNETPGFLGHFKVHASALTLVGVATVVGALASFAFQVLTARGLGPAAFGLVSAFFAIVNVAAIGSSSLQNSVAVHTAQEPGVPGGTGKSVSRWPAAAIAVGLIGGAGLALASPWVAQGLESSVGVVLAAAVCIPLSFLFADALGLIQGTGNSSGAVWWSTISLLIRVAVTVLAFAVGLGVGGVIGAVVFSMAAALAGALWTARRIRRPTTGVFTPSGVTVMVLTISFAWLTNSDVIILRAGAPEDVAGNYASATVLVKAAFLLPATLSMYLLPRFVRNRADRRLTRLGVGFTLAITGAAGVVMVVFFAVAGDWVVGFLFGDQYQVGSDLLVAVSLAYLPWIMAQGMLIRVTSFASKAAAAVLVGSIPVQWIVFTTFVPDLAAMLIAFGIIGLIVVVAFIMISWYQSRDIPSTPRRGSP